MQYFWGRKLQIALKNVDKFKKVESHYVWEFPNSSTDNAIPKNLPVGDCVCVCVYLWVYDLKKFVFEHKEFE